MFRRFYFPNIARNIRILCYEGSFVLFKRSKDIVCSHHSPKDCLSISVIRRQWVYPPKSCVTWVRTPTLWIEAHIFENKGWESVKLIYKQRAAKLLKCGDFLNETWYHRNTRTSLFYPQNGRLVPCVDKTPTHWVEMPTLVYLVPPYW